MEGNKRRHRFYRILMNQEEAEVDDRNKLREIRGKQQDKL